MIELTRLVPEIITTTFASSITVNTGTVITGVTADTQTANTDYFQVEEVAATPGFLIECAFLTAVTEQDIVKFWGRYDGGNIHEVEAEIFNWDTSSWNNMRDTTLDFPESTIDYYREFSIPGTKSDYSSATSGHIFRFNHTSGGSATHDMYIDKICIEG